MVLADAGQAAPRIRTDADNPVPACVTPYRLMAFVGTRNSRIDPRFQNIASWYQYYGNAWQVRWDYAFFQMLLETNYLSYRRPDGRRGDVHENQNNFAGIGATGGGVPGDRFPDVGTGVHAQIQHLVAYSGERLAAPVAPRTQLKQDDIIEASRRLRRPVTFGDLARRWAADRHYARSIDYVAGEYARRFCNGETADAAPPPRPARFAPPSGLGGPKPAQLAGPGASAGEEVLPWERGAEPVAGPPSSSDAAEAPRTAPKRAVRANPKPAAVERPSEPTPAPAITAGPAADMPRPRGNKAATRTIWSRGDGAVPAPASPSAPAPAEAVSSEAAQPAAEPPRTMQDAQAAPAAAAGGDAAATSSPAASLAASLPTFRIAPTVAEPSKLGGPASDAPAPSVAGASAPALPCKVLSASFGGTKTLLLRSSTDGATHYTALTVLDGFERSMFDIYTRANAPGAELVGEYPSKEAALSDARSNCPDK